MLLCFCIGAFGVDFTHSSGEGIDIVRKGLLQFGVTGFCPTIVTTTSSNYHKVRILTYFVELNLIDTIR